MSEVAGTPDGLIRTSLTIGNVIPALARVQAAMGGTVQKDKVADTGKFSYGYVSLGAVQEAAEEAMKAEGLFWVSATYLASVTVRLYHVSGEWIETEIALSSQGLDARGVGSVTTFGRRYGLMALLGLSAEDDDAGDAQRAQPPAQAQRKPAQGGYRSDAPPPARGAAPQSSVMLSPCPKCGGDLLDQRAKKRSDPKFAKIPEVACSDWKGCKTVYWKFDEAPQPQHGGGDPGGEFGGDPEAGIGSLSSYERPLF